MKNLTDKRDFLALLQLIVDDFIEIEFNFINNFLLYVFRVFLTVFIA